MTKALIFDFDGVIVESVKLKSNAFASIYKPYGLKIMKKVVKHHEENGGMSRFEKFKYYHENYLNIEITNSEIKKLANQFSQIVIKEVISCPYVPGVLSFIKSCYGKYKIFISTGTPTEEIKIILKERNINKYFLEVFGSPSSKSSHVKKIKEKYTLESNEIIFFGDSNSDSFAAITHDIPFVLRVHALNRNINFQFKGMKINDFTNFVLKH